MKSEGLARAISPIKQVVLYIDTDRDMVDIETMSGSELLNILINSLQEPPAKQEASGGGSFAPRI
ncbi:MAG: hypothetical protein QHH10_14115 [Peptococcaceae bacterium]|nr:hypothetical protein [Peptococcaceae bacterium]MDH7526431.1 hypothetical protein [Peptococcaceae bacterium]